MWYLFALLSACSSTVRRAGDKQLSHKLHFLTLGWAQQLCSLPIISVVLILFGRFINPFTLGVRFWLPTTLYALVLYPLFLYFYLNAIKHGELSKVLPIQSLTPIFVMITARIFIGQTPTPLAAFGTILVILGVYVLNLKDRYLHNPLRVFSTDKPNAYMLASLIVTAFAGVCDKVAIQASEPVYYTLVNSIISLMVLLFISSIMRVNRATTLKTLIKPLLASGTLSGTSFLLYVFALQTGPLAYISTLKSTSILMGSIVGFTYFKEHVSKLKVAALILITIGSVVLGLAA